MNNRGPDAASAAAGYTLLVVDDEPDLRTLYELTLLREGYEIETAGTVEGALAQLAERRYSAIITDMRLPDGTGLDLLRHLEDRGRSEKALVITAYGSAENAVEALKAGAYDYLTKPVDLKQFRLAVASALGRPAPALAARRRRRRARQPQPAASSPPARSSALSRMAGTSAAMQQVRELVHKVARSMAPVLVNGESGTGKELVARAIHEVSSRATQPLRRGQLRRDPGAAARGRILRLSQGRLHRRRRGPGRLLPGRQRRHAVSRRDRRPAAGDAEQAAARGAGARGAAGRRGRRAAGRRAPAQRDPQGSGRRSAGRALPPGSVSTGST